MIAVLLLLLPRASWHRGQKISCLVAHHFLSSSVGVKLITCFPRSYPIQKLSVEGFKVQEKDLTSNYVVHINEILN